LALVMPAVASATFPGENGRVLFITDNANPPFLSAFPGSTETVEVAEGYGVGEYSPDGTKMVYGLERHVAGCNNGEDPCPGRHEIYIANADGSGEAFLTYTGEFEADPSIHPSGNRVVFYRDNDAYEVNLTNGNETRLVRNAERPRYSPDGSQIVFGRDGDVFLMDADGSNVRNLTQSMDDSYSGNASWAPDGETVFYDSDPDGVVKSQIKSIPASSTDGSGDLTIGPGAYPIVSPDGERIAFTGNSPTTTMFTMTLTGTDVTLLGPTVAESIPLSWQPVANAESSTVGDGESVSTAAEATETDPAQASVTTPSGGTVNVAINPYNGSPQSGFASVGHQFNISAPAASVADPLLVTLLIDASAVPAGFNASTLEVFRNGVLVADCTDPTQAVPDPCVGDRTDLVDGDVSLGVRTSQASIWDVAAVDDTDPKTNLKKVPKETTKRSLAIKFSSNEDGASFNCTLDGKKRACVSPYLTGKLSRGKHTFSVVSTDAAGNKDDTPAKAKFEVVKK